MKYAASYIVIAVICLALGQANTPAPARAQTPAPSSPPSEPLSIKISGPHKPVLGDRPVWVAELRGDAGTPRWRISPPTTGIVEKFNGQAIEWEPPYAGEFTISVSVGGANKTSADDVFNITVFSISQPPAVAPVPIEQSQPQPLLPETPPAGRLAALPPKDKAWWSGRVAELVSNVGTANKVAEARAIGGCVLNLVLRVERDNFGGAEYAEDLRRQAIALFGPQRAAPWDQFFAGLGRDLTLQDLRFIEHALAHVVLAANRGSVGGKITAAKET